MTARSSTFEEIAMTASASERLDELFESYILALVAVDQCPDSATEELKWRLRENVERAEKVFADGTADGLGSDSAVVDEEVRQLAEANLMTRTALRDGKAIAASLLDLENGTAHAVRVLMAARR
jgi:hypothetical protein